MTHEELQQFITAWIAGAEAELDTPEYEKYFWAFSLLSDLTDPLESGGSAENAEEAWKIILAINQRPLSGEVIACLAAGPLEELLSYHGESFIERVEQQAQSDPKFNYLLGGVWRLFMSETIWERVQAARDEVW